ncbi:hypothetical protein V5O48_003722 [Marasmius crinis-equi]|uniref:BZIP domain-containing protein n=1 Tax=Marasmius crinis-equi TaxID=585013 RepID=A0ABR3FSV3_9AGAR
MTSSPSPSPLLSGDHVVLFSSEVISDTGVPLTNVSFPSTPPISSSTSENSDVERDQSSNLETVRSSPPSPTVDRAAPKTVSWGTSDNEWGSGQEWADADPSSGWNTWNSTVQTPQITSLTSRSRAASDHDDTIFHWRPSESSVISHKHISQYARTDLQHVFKTTGIDTSSPSELDQAATPVWARTQLIRALPEAQRSKIPGPFFSLSQLKVRRADHICLVRDTEAKLVQNNSKLRVAREQQRQLRSQIGLVESRCKEMERANSDMIQKLVALEEVTKDLEDLEALVLVYC